MPNSGIVYIRYYSVKLVRLWNLRTRYLRDLHKQLYSYGMVY